MILTSTFSKTFLILDFCDPNFCYQCSIRAWSYWLGWLDPLTSWALFFGGRSTLHSYPRRVCSSSFGHVTTCHPVAATSLKAHAPHQLSVLIGSCLYQRPTMEECKTVAGNDVNDHWMQRPAHIRPENGSHGQRTAQNIWPQELSSRLYLFLAYLSKKKVKLIFTKLW